MKRRRGMSVVEALIGATILTIFISAIVLAYQSFFVRSLLTIEDTQAAFLAEEGIEAVKYLRDKDWNTYIANGTYSLEWDSEWDTTGTPVYIDEKFLRTFTIENVNRDNYGAITTSGGTNDPNTKKVTVNVEWPRGNGSTTRTMATYVTNFHEE